MNKIILLLLITLMSLQAAGQGSEEDIVKKYNAFRKEYPNVKIYLVFNQYMFAPGDTVWFKAYFLNPDNSVVKGRQLLDLSVVGSEGAVIQHFLFSVTDGIGFNQFVFPETTAPGIYTVAAYNSWMMNFDPPPLFSKEIEVIGEKSLVTEAKPQGNREFRVGIFPNPGGRKVTLTFSAKEGSTTRYQDLLLVLTRSDKILHTKTFRLGLKSSESITFDWIPGPVGISVIDKAGRALENMTYNFPDIDALTENPFKISIAADGGGVKARSKAKLTVTIVDKNDRPVQGEFSLSVLNFGEERDTRFFSDMTFMAEYPKSEPWRQIFSGRGETRSGFTTNLFRTGTAYYNDGVTPLPGGTTLVFYLQNNDLVLQATIMAGGKFTLPLRDITKGDELIALAETNGDPIEGLKIQWEHKAIVLPSPPSSREGQEANAFGVFASTKKLIDKAFAFYGSEESSRPVRSVEPRTESFLEERIGVPDHSVNIQKYVTFPTMNELIREIIPSLQTRVSRGRNIVQVTLREPMPVAKADPVYIIDGIVTKDSKFFISMKPSDVATIKVVTNPAKLIPLGLIGRNGIVIMETIKGSARPPFDAWQIVEGINPVIPFRQHTYKDGDQRRPDLRSTIFWAPTVQTDANGKAEIEFVHSDDIGAINVILKGLTKDGKELSHEAVFKATLK